MAPAIAFAAWGGSALHYGLDIPGYDGDVHFATEDDGNACEGVLLIEINNWAGDGGVSAEAWFANGDHYIDANQYYDTHAVSQWCFAVGGAGLRKFHFLGYLVDADGEVNGEWY